jgi:hypothetical protein
MYGLSPEGAKLGTPFHELKSTAIPSRHREVTPSPPGTMFIVPNSS